MTIAFRLPVTTFRGLIGQLPGLRLAVPASDLEFKPGMAIHSLRELPVVWGEP